MGSLLCLGDKDNFNLLDLRNGTLLPVMPLSHSGVAPGKPIITVIGSNEFLIVSNLDDRGLAVFISGNGDPVRGTFEYPKYPLSVCKSVSCGWILRPFNLIFFVVPAYDSPYLVALMPDQSLEIRDIETQSVKQVVPPPEPPSERPNQQRRGLIWNPHGHIVPSAQLKDDLQLVPVPLIR